MVKIKSKNPKRNNTKPQRDSRNKSREDSLSKIYGINACMAFAKSKPGRIYRAFFSKDVAPKFSGLMKEMANDKKVYRIITDAELEKVSQSQHHEGVCFNVEADEIMDLEKWFKSEKPKDVSVLVGLDNVGNPHNLGAIMRSAAHFGVDGIAMSNPRALQSGAARRTAEGGAEFIQVVRCVDTKEVIRKAKKEGYTVVTTTSHGGQSLYKTKFPNKCVLIFGEEGPGLSEEILSSGDLEIQIPGTLNVESLNVSTAISIILGEIWRQKKD